MSEPFELGDETSGLFVGVEAGEVVAASVTVDLAGCELVPGDDDRVSDHTDLKTILEQAIEGTDQADEHINRERIPGPCGGAWNRTAVHGIIENVAYAGERYAVKRAHPAIISRRAWNTANAEFAKRSRSK